MDFPSRHISSSCFPLFPVLKFCWAKLICLRLYQSFFPPFVRKWILHNANFLESKTPHHECAALLHWKCPICFLQPELSCYSWLLQVLFTIVHCEFIWISPWSGHRGAAPMDVEQTASVLNCIGDWYNQSEEQRKWWNKCNNHPTSP